MKRDWLEDEEKAFGKAKSLIRKLGPVAARLWHIGDGNGGWLFDELRKAAVENGAVLPERNHTKNRRTVSRHIRELVIVRDGLSCHSMSQGERSEGEEAAIGAARQGIPAPLSHCGRRGAPKGRVDRRAVAAI